VLAVHAFVAVQEVAFVEDQASVDVPPVLTLVGVALSETVGGAGVTVTVVVCWPIPPVPWQTSE
jgi:hypothetical protein